MGYSPGLTLGEGCRKTVSHGEATVSAANDDKVVTVTEL
jgi:hypothetical protein